MTKRHECKSVAFCFTAREIAMISRCSFRPEAKPYATAYWLAPEAGAAAEAAASEAAAPASEAAVVAEAAAALAAAALEAAAPASEATPRAKAADASLAGAAAWSLLLLHAASATAANRDATRRDFFMIT